MNKWLSSATWRKHLSSAIALMIGFLILPGLACAQYGPDDEAETLAAMRPKLEADTALPAFPKTPDLLPVDTGPTARQSFAIDAQSLSVSADHIVRYTVVSTSSSGAKNISYEGIDCKSREYRRYAYGIKGAKGNQWVRSRSDKWERISSMAQNQLHFTLHAQYFCEAGLAIGKASDLVTRIRYGRVNTY